MMAPDRGILPGFVIAFILVSLQRMIALQSCKSEQFENFSQGRYSTLISDGVLSLNELKRVSISHERVFAQLRALGILQLGTVSRLYLEPGGNFTLIPNPTPQAGLPVLPPWDTELSDFFIIHHDKQICVQCGFPQKNVGKAYKLCPNCGSPKWITAVQEKNNRGNDE